MYDVTPTSRRRFFIALPLVLGVLAPREALAYVNDCTHFVDGKLVADCAGTYSVSARDCSGNNGDGYSAAHLQKALDALGPGDTLCLREGFYEPAPFEIRSKGNEGARITIGAYGDESVRLRQPHPGGGMFIKVSGSYLTIGGFTVSTWDQQNGGTCVWQKAPGHHVTYDQMTFKECGESGITIHGRYADGFTHDITVQYSHFQNIGQGTADEAIAWTAEAYNLHVHHCTFDDVIDSLLVDFGDNSIIYEYNRVTNVRGENAVDTKQTYPIYQDQPGRWTDGFAHIRYNDFGSTSATGGPPGSPISGLIHTGNNSRYIRIYGNYFHDYSKNGIWLNARSAKGALCDHGDVSNIYIYNNIFDTMASNGIIFGSDDDITTDCDPPHEYRDIHVYNNTLIDCGLTGTTAFGAGIYYYKNCNPQSHGIHIANNLLVGNNPGNAPHVQLAVSSAEVAECPGLFLDHNLYWYNGESRLFRVGSDFATLSEWTASHGHDGASLNADPQLELAGARPLPYARLGPGSPAINAGRDLSEHFSDDFEGQPRQAGAWDIGADEYGVAGGGAGGGGGLTGTPTSPDEKSGCGCRSVGKPTRGGFFGVWLVASSLLLVVGRWRARRLWGAVAAACLLGACSENAPVGTTDAYADGDGDASSENTPVDTTGACTDEDGDYYVVGHYDDPVLACGRVCGPNHNEVCQESDDCDDSDPNKTVGESCVLHLVVADAYYVTNKGNGDHSGRSFLNALSVSEHNNATFAPGDTIYIAETITVSESLTPPSSGSEEQPITYRGDHPDHPGALEQPLGPAGLRQLMLVRNRQHLQVVNLRFNGHDTNDDHDNYAGLWVEEEGQATGKLRVSGCSFSETVNGILVRGDVRHMDIVRSSFRKLVNNGIWLGHYYGASEELVPSFVTVGGAREYGNTFVNVGREDSPSSGSVPGAAFGQRVVDAVFSYNHVYADEPGWGTGLYLNGVSRVLVEHNYLHDLDSVHRRSPISFKSDFSWKNKDIVIRFNKVGPTHDGGTYTDLDSAIRFNNCLDVALVYGNLVQDVHGIGIMSTWGWDQAYTSDGCIPENVFIHANIVATTRTGSGIYLAGTSGSDHFARTYITNNLVYHAANENVTDNPQHSYGIQLLGDEINYQDVFLYNNIVDTPRSMADDHIGLWIPYQSDMWADYNHHYFPNATPAVYYTGSDCTPCSWNSTERPTGYGVHDSFGDPRYRDALAADFAFGPGSPCIGTGTSLDVAARTVTIQGKTLSFNLAEGLDPLRTNFGATIPFVHTLRQDKHGDWERGPFVYTED